MYVCVCDVLFCFVAAFFAMVFDCVLLWCLGVLASHGPHSSVRSFSKPLRPSSRHKDQDNHGKGAGHVDLHPLCDQHIDVHLFCSTLKNTHCHQSRK